MATAWSYLLMDVRERRLAVERDPHPETLETLKVTLEEYRARQESVLEDLEKVTAWLHDQAYGAPARADRRRRRTVLLTSEELAAIDQAVRGASRG